MKTRDITLHKNEILYDIESLAYKYAEGSALEGKAKNTLAADHNETLDGNLLGRMMETDSKTGCCDVPGAEDDYIFNLSLNDKFDDNMLDVIKTQMHEYVVRGVLLDWYKRMGVQTYAVDAGEVLELEESIVSVLRSPSYSRAPLQPFGPRKSII